MLVIGISFATIGSMTESDTDEGFGTSALDYISNNILGSEGLGSFGGGDTDIEGDDS